ncbi:MAG: deoxyribose-phosphate aldolase [Chitinophagaceae bacterium]|nr:deoxyribose-phosphate aldolase [Chitinophagaceae bacterium]
MDIAAKIDHTLLKPETTLEQIKQLCAEAIENQFATVCVPPYYVRNAFAILENEKVKIATVIGFPFGYSSAYIKVEEAKRAMEDGAHELDVVMNLGAFYSGNDKDVLKELQSITQLAHLRGKMVKLIIEAGLLSESDLKRACALAVKAEVDYVKTSTGFVGQGATVEMIETMRKLLPKKIKIKASGGIKTKAQLLQLIEAGADRIGTSSAMQMMEKVEV